MPEEMQLIQCGKCHKQAHGLYSPAAMNSAYIAGFYSVARGTPWHRYGQEGEKFLCKACLHDRMREERRDMLP